ncbi:YbaN family protein [Parabacteroides sp. OttesenSCG-928-N08]|nr:YbaN family protein [Parabacteroides sp. OttesenSCG-928-N08]
MNQPKRILYIALGSLFLFLGTLGIFLPLLPTTPFWLLTCWFYLRSSERLYQRVMRNRYFGNYIRSYMEDKAMPLRAKIVTLTIMWGSMIITSLFLYDRWWIPALLFVIAVGVTWHILSFPTRK